MTNKQRQLSLERKNGMDGEQPYCIHCTEGDYDHRKDMLVCLYVGKEFAYTQCPCATAYNRMMRRKV